MTDQEFTPRVFISYAWEGGDIKERVRALADRLRNDGVDARLDQYDEHQPDPWPRWMNDQIDLAHKVLMVFTPTYRDRFEGKDTPSGNGVAHEGLVVQQYLYDAKGKNKKFRAILFTGFDHSSLALPIKPYTSYRPDDPSSYEDLVRWLYDSPKNVAPPLGKRPSFLSPLTSLPGIAKVEDIYALPDRYFRMRDELIRQCQKIPIFGQMMEDIPMDKNFVRLRLSISSGEVDDSRRSHNARAKFLESDDLLRTGKRRRWGEDEPDERKLRRSLRHSVEVPELWKNYPKTAILGLPGAGKTTILRHFVYLATRLKKMPVVIFVACRSLRGIHFTAASAADDRDGYLTAAAAFLFPSFGDPVADEDDIFHPAATAEEVTVRRWSEDQLLDIRALASGMRDAAAKQQLVLLVDAYDETPESYREDVSIWLKKLTAAVPTDAAVPQGITGNRCYTARHQDL